MSSLFSLVWGFVVFVVSMFVVVVVYFVVVVVLNENRNNKNIVPQFIKGANTCIFNTLGNLSDLI